MSKAVLSINAGSSSIKFSVHALPAGGDEPLLRCGGQVEGIGHDAQLLVHDDAGRTLGEQSLGPSATLETALLAVRNWIDEHFPDHSIMAAGHRVVHGGDEFDGPVLVDDAVLDSLERFVPMVPSHQPHNLGAIRAIRASHPDLPQVACFDTAFHQTQADLARAYALPREFSAAGIRRYGFHGLSYEFIASVLPDFAGHAANGRVIVAHLGHGASMCAMRGRRSVATTMGFSALDGLPMGERCGALDPGIVPYLARERGMDVAEIEDILYHKSGLLGVSGISDDMRDLLASDAPEAAWAVELFCYRAGREIGSLAAAIGGLDVLVFTGGIGEHAAPVRLAICSNLEYLGIEMDWAANTANAPVITTPDSKCTVEIIPTDEDAMIARHVYRLLCVERVGK
jgi:acetate kinase